VINCLYVAHDGTVYAGTTTGLARSSDGGKMWRFLRGADWLEKRDGQHPESWLDGGLVNLANVRAIEVLPQSGSPVRLAVGGPGGGGWQADYGFVGGQSFHTGDALDSSAVQNPAPQSVYQYGRFGSFVYTIPNLKPCVSCRVRLHLADVDFDKPGQRVFNVGVNGKRVLTHEDIVAEAGAKDKVIVKEFPATADAQGQVVLSFRGSQPLPSLDKHSPYELSEDYVTALAEDGAGHLLVGHQQKGVEVLDPATGKPVAPKAAASPATDFVTALLPRPDGTLLISGYGAGLSQMPIIGTTHDGVFTQTAGLPAALPTPEPPPTLAELAAALAHVKSLHGEMSAGSAAYLGADWQTQGDWVGRYGRQYAILCAASAPLDHDIISDLGYRVTGSMGPRHEEGDSIRRWVTWAQTSQHRSLYDPIPGYRRQAEWDDHGEAYPVTAEGPDVWATVTVPAGLHELSLYDVNKDGHFLDDRYRDYVVDLLPYRPNMETVEKLPSLAHARIRDFWGGVYHSFLVRGPAQYYVRVRRNGSFNTILAGVFLDSITGPKTRFDCSAWMGGVRYSPPDPDAPIPPDPHLLDKLLAKEVNEQEVVNLSTKPVPQSIVAARALWAELDKEETNASAVPLQYRYRLLAYRAISGAADLSALQANWRWKLHLWTEADRQKFEETMAEAHASLLEYNPQMKGAQY